MRHIKSARFYIFNLNYKIFTGIIIFLALGLILSCRLGIKAENESREVISWAMAGKLIIIDPGHGGTDPGVVSPGGLLEKELNMTIARYLGELLRYSGAEIIFTREGDTPLAAGKREDLCARAQLALDNPAAAFISLHGNSFPLQPSQKGAQVFYSALNPAGRELAMAVQGCLSSPPMESRRKALPHSSSYLLKNIKIPAIIIEAGFFSNPEEEKLLQQPEYQWQLAYGIFMGIVDFFAREA